MTTINVAGRGWRLAGGARATRAAVVPAGLRGPHWRRRGRRERRRDQRPDRRASSRRRCSRSPARRCSSARSSSSTRSRSPSPSARASSPCCARSALRARQILGAVALEALVIGVAASGLGSRARSRVRQGARVACSRPSGSGSPREGAELAPRTIARRRSASASASRSLPRSDRRDARRASRRSRRFRERRPGPPGAAGRPGSPAIAAVARRRDARRRAVRPADRPRSRLSMMAGGVVLLFVGVALSARWFVRPLAGAVGWPLERLFAEPGLLARENAMRNPGRTATTAAALMVGLGLVVFVAVFANGIKASFDETVDQVVGADVIVRSDTMQPIPAGAGQCRRSVARRLGEHERADRPGQGQRQEQLEHRHGHHQWRRAGQSRRALPGGLGDGRRRGRWTNCAATRRSSRSSSRRRTTCRSARASGSRRPPAARPGSRPSACTATLSCSRGRSSRRSCSPECPLPATRG